MGNQYVIESRKSFKNALKMVIFSLILLSGLSFGQYSAIGEGEALAENQAEIVPVAEETAVEPEYEVIPADQIPAEEIEPSAGAMNEKILSADAKIIWQKNSEYFGNFIPNKVYILEDSGDRLEIESVQMVTDEGGDEYNVFAFGADQNEDNSYAFRLKTKRGEKNWEAEFQEFISNFKK